MRMLLIFSAVGVLSGCVTQPADPWQDLTVEVEPATAPIECRMPLPDEVIGQSIVYETAHSLEAYRVCSEANEALVEEHAAQIQQLKIPRQHLVEAGQAQRHIADMRQEMLEDERRHNFWTSVGYWVVIIGLAASL